MGFHVVDVLTGEYLGDPVVFRNGWFMPVPEGAPTQFVPKLPILSREVIQTDESGAVTLHLSCRADVIDEIGDGPLIAENRAWDDTLGAVTVTRVRSWPPLTHLKAEKKASLAALRFEIETGGIMIANMTVKTDRESQALITGKQVYLDKVATATEVKWKAESGWVTIPREQFEQIAVAVAEHVQRCFDREGELVDEIDAIPADDPVAARSALDTIDIEGFWPTL